MDKARIRVDFNELIQEDLVLLSKVDEVIDSEGHSFVLTQGMPVAIYEYNKYQDGGSEYLLAEGIVELNNPEINSSWSKAAKWCCRINGTGIIVKNG